MRPKFETFIKFIEKNIDVFLVSKTKLDGSFPNN